MKNKTAILLLLVLLQFSAYPQQTYQLDLKKSKILWKAPKAMGNQHYGYLLFSYGNLNYLASGEPMSGSFGMDMNSIRSTDHKSATENAKVDKELKTDFFFDVAKYPAATMNVKQIARTDNPGMYHVSGDLTIKGVTHPIQFMATILSKGSMIQVNADLTIDRTRWNIKHQPKPKSWDFFATVKEKVIDNEIPVSLNLVFNKGKSN